MHEVHFTAKALLQAHRRDGSAVACAFSVDADEDA